MQLRPLHLSLGVLALVAAGCGGKVLETGPAPGSGGAAGSAGGGASGADGSSAATCASVCATASRICPDANERCAETCEQTRGTVWQCSTEIDAFLACAQGRDVTCREGGGVGVDACSFEEQVMNECLAGWGPVPIPVTGSCFTYAPRTSDLGCVNGASGGSAGASGSGAGICYKSCADGRGHVWTGTCQASRCDCSYDGARICGCTSAGERACASCCPGLGWN